MKEEKNIRLDEINDDITLIQRKNGLAFGTDALLLSAYIDGKHDSALELGSGTGVISLFLLKRNKTKTITALEIQPEFAQITEENARNNGLDDSFRVLCCDLRSFHVDQKISMVFTNPPYMRCDSGKRNLYDEKNIARHEVKGTILDFCKCASRSLKFGGSFYVVYRPDRLVDLICAMRECKIEPKRMTFVCADEASTPSMVLIEGKSGAAASMRVTPPLFIYKDKDRALYSDDYKYILNTGNFPQKFRITNARTRKESTDGNRKKSN